jgi:hypothetical protein
MRCNSKEHSRLLIFLCVFLTLRLCNVQKIYGGGLSPPEPPSTTPLRVLRSVTDIPIIILLTEFSLIAMHHIMKAKII